MDDKAKIPYGALDIAARELEDASKDFDSVWQGGHQRMRPEDIDRVKKYQKRIATAEKSIKATLKLFEAVK